MLHWDEQLARYQPVAVVAQDTEMNTVDVEVRSFSPFAMTFFGFENLPANYPSNDGANFDPLIHGWPIDNNFASYFTPNGNCLGMAAYCAWYYAMGLTPLSSTTLTTVPEPTSETHILATRAHLAQSQYWSRAQAYPQVLIPEQLVVLAMKAALVATGEPLVVLMTRPNRGGHASIVYGYG